MHQDVVILLEVQQEDAVIFDLEDKLAALAPRLAVLEADTQRAEQAQTDAHASVTAEEKRQRDVQMRIDQHRDLLKRHEEVLNNVTSPREATAAMAQTEQARRMLGDDEREMVTIRSRLDELRANAVERGHDVETTRAAQAEARESLEVDRKQFVAELKSARGDRDQKVARISRGLMTRYDRIQRRQRSIALFPLRGQSCSNCDTVVPMQRKNVMAASGAAEVCEGCGVLLYAAD
ncbi:MAG TPA: hypothetical protein VIJ16_10485 [Gemmatimonadaceae bacterium]